MPKILIVDDEWLTRLEIEEMLTDLGYDVSGQAETGAEAVAMARELNPDLILMDVEMPGEMNGIDAARVIKAELGTPIVFVSGHDDPEHIEAAKEIAPFGYVMKPFDEREIHAFVEIALSKRKLELKLEEAHDELERRVESRTAELEEANKQLQEENEAHKRTEEELRESEEHLRSFMESAKGFVVYRLRIDPKDYHKAHVAFVSPSLKDIIGVSPQEQFSEWFKDIHEDDLPSLINAQNESAQSGVPLDQEFRFKSLEGEWRWLHVISNPVFDSEGKPEYYNGITIDITEQKQATQALREKERFGEGLLDDMITFVAVLDPSGNVIFVNNTPLTVGGIKLEDIRGKKFFDAIWWTHSDEVREMVKRDIEQCASGESIIHDVPIQTADGSLMWIEFSMHPIHDEYGVVQYLIPEGRDITTKKLAEETLRKSEEKFRTLFDTSPHAIALTEMKTGKIVDVNDKFCQLTDYKKDEVIGRSTPQLGFYSEDDRNRFVDELTDSGKVHGLEMDFRAKHGSIINAHMFAVPIQFEGEALVLTEFYDVTEQKRTKKALLESEEKFRSLAENQHDVVWTVNENLEVDYISPSCFKMTGTTAEKTIGKKPNEFYTEESYQRIIMKLAEERQKSANEMQSTVLEVDQYHEDGHLFPVEITCIPVIIDNKFVGVQGITRDITERKKAEEEIRKLSTAVEQSPSVIAITDLKGNLKYVNPQFTELTGYTSEEAINKNRGILKSGHQSDGMYKELWQTISSGNVWRGEFHNKKKNGELFWESASVSPIFDKQGKITNYVKVAEDISERKQAEEKVKKSEKRLKSIFESIPSPIVVYNTEGHPLYLNPAFTELFLWSLDELEGRCIPFVPDDQRDLSNIKVEEVYRTGKIVRYETKRLTKYGDVVDVIVSGAFITGAEGDPVEMVTNLTEITGLKRAEEGLRASEEKYRTILESIEDGYYELDIDGNFTFFNDSLCEIYGYSRNELIGSNIRKFSDQETSKRGHSYFNKVYATGRSEKGFEWPITRKDGTNRVVEASVSLRRNAEGAPKGFRGIVRDISEKQSLEAQLHQAQKMEAIGTLAGGVAHDLNNILGGLVSYPELLLLQLPKDSPLRKSILTIQKSGEKAAAVVQDLLTLARRGVVVTDPVNLNDVIADYLKSPEHEKLKSYHPTVHIETHIEKDTLNILGSSTHLSKTIMNLVSNAAEAMPEGGNLIVSTENRYIDRPIRDYDHVKEGDYVVLTISDTGTGISSDDMEKIFEPFYTKKKMGRSGTGLGMAVVWGTLKDHNGYIDVQSTEGKGTTFALYFPVTRERLPENKSHLAIASYNGNGESILIVDDVEEQRKIATGMLKELGYSVVSVSSGEKAVEYLRTNKIDLLVLDMIMDPGMDGLETYRKIIEIHPEQKAIIASGFSETDRVKAVQSLGAGAYIRKPLLLEKIGLAVKEELEK